MVCAECGSDQVQIKEWRWVNTGEYAGMVSDGEADDNWCENCQEHTHILSEQEYNAAKLN